LTVDEYIEDQLEKKIYKKLMFYDAKWYETYGIDFVFNNEAFRIINKVILYINSAILPIRYFP
jgi:hypothetical protein